MKRYDRIRTYFYENLIIVIPLVITGLLYGGLMCILPRIEGKTIDSLLDGGFKHVLRYVIIFICLVLFLQVNRFFKRYFVRVFANKISLRMRKKSMHNLLHKDLSFFAANDAGDILNRNLSDIYDATEGIRKMTTEVFDSITLVIGYLISLFFLDWKITLYMMGFVTLSILTAHYMKVFVYKSNKSYKEYLSINKQLTISKLNNELNYRGLGVSKEYYQEYANSLETLRKKNMKTLIFQSSLEPFYSSIALIGVAFIAYLGGKNVIDGIYQIGTFSAYLTTYLLISKRAGKAGRAFNAYQGLKVSWGRCQTFLGNIEEPNGSLEMNDEGLSLSNFTYQYETGFTLPSINLKVPKKTIIGVCGRVHTGKTTVLRALTGLYDYHGSASIGGIPIKNLKDQSKQYVGYCATDVAIFADNLENNIRLGREGDFEKAVNCSKLDIDELGGLEAQMSRTNANISGGQQKRLQMARALYPQTPLVLLDDPFQSVEEDLALQMMDCLQNMDSEIVVLVSNNAKILSRTNQVIYLEENKVEIENYKSLLTNQGFKQLMGGEE